MYSIRCPCGKIVCQVDNMPYLPKVEEEATPIQGPAVVILCRHCKRYVVLKVPTISTMRIESVNGHARDREMISAQL